MIFESCCSDFESVDQEELLEIMDIHNCRRLPAIDNIEKILRALAHQKLIQEPAFVIEQWSNILAPVRSELKGIAAVYEELQPTSRKIAKSITYPSTQNALEKQMVKYVSAHLRELDIQRLSFFLRFCTGSDQLLIHVAVTWSCQSQQLPRFSTLNICVFIYLFQFVLE